VRYQVEDAGDAKRINEAAARTRAGGAAGAITLRAARHRAAASRLPDSPLSGRGCLRPPTAQRRTASPFAVFGVEEPDGRSQPCENEKDAFN
jgi:hypothetical protein